MDAAAPYVELHLHSCWSMREGASKPVELLARASELGYDTLALTDHDGLYGSMEFAKRAREEGVGIRPITGAELTLSDGSHLTVLAETVEGYRNLCRLLSLAHRPDREQPHTDREVFFAHSKGLIVLSGCREGEIARLLDDGATGAAETIAGEYRERLGGGQFFLELQHHGIYGDSQRVAALARLSGAHRHPARGHEQRALPRARAAPAERCAGGHPAPADARYLARSPAGELRVLPEIATDDGPALRGLP